MKEAVEGKRERLGLMLGFIGVLCFSLTLPTTSIAVAYFGPTMVGLGRGVIASVLVAIVLLIRREKRPTAKQFKGLAIVALGAVLGFPLLTSWAMQSLPASHGAVVLALLPLATAGFATLRAGEFPSVRFWLASLAGCSAILVYAFYLGFGQLKGADFALLAAVIIVAFSYAEGGRLARDLGGWQVIAWALVIAAPFFIIPVLMFVTEEMLYAPLHAWISFLYLAVVSQFLAFVAWYNGLAMGGIARVSQVQYLQPFLMILFSAWLLDESISLFTLGTSVFVVLSVIIGKQTSVRVVPTKEPYTSQK
ncbi:DMT family transporter [Brevibacillus ruminantium]|uniref:DMT family transporter n=1 Tax=Brevibacillus ruminantium TaxID=2950604 RepID=A0ABY4WLB8_9BACL|nr:DMT family transporter [Brevibacillus ruminantium]USG66169.1 DMT family transporter [Brevibacillus ruminantium]